MTTRVNPFASILAAIARSCQTLTASWQHHGSHRKILIRISREVSLSHARNLLEMKKLQDFDQKF